MKPVSRKTPRNGPKPAAPGLVVLDMDRVIVRGQSQLLLLGHLRREGQAPLGPVLRIAGWYCLYRLGLRRDPSGIARYAFSFLRDRPEKEVHAIFESFFETRLRPSIYPEIRGIIAEHRAAGREIAIISSAVDLVAGSVARHLGIKRVISTVLEKKGGVYTGRAAGNLVHGRAKARAFRRLPRAGITWAYADDISDLPLLEAVDRPVAVNPCPRLRKEARARGWPILDFAIPGNRFPGPGPKAPGRKKSTKGKSNDDHR